MIRVTVRGEDGLDDMAGALGRSPRQLDQRLRLQMRQAARPVQGELRRAFMSVPMHARREWAPKSPRRVGSAFGNERPLRRPIANAVKVETPGGAPRVRIKLDDRLVPLYARWLVRYVTSPRFRLRHPFLDKWRHAVSHPGVTDVWNPTLKRAMPRFERGVNRAVADTADAIERSA